MNEKEAIIEQLQGEYNLSRRDAEKLYEAIKGYYSSN